MFCPALPRLYEWLIAALVALAACGEATTPDGPSETHLAISGVTASDNQSAMSGTALPHPLKVLVQGGGRPKANVPITWATSAGSVTPTSSVTDTDGVAVTQWTLGLSTGIASATATLAGAEGSPVIFHAAALTRPGMTATIASGNGQTGQVASPLPIPLRIRVQTSAPSDAGVTVNWTPSEGQVSPASSVTDAQGYAETTWTLGTVAKDTEAVVARISGAEGSPLRFTARALPGPAVEILTLGADSQVAYTAPAYTTTFNDPLVALRDGWGNDLPRPLVTWSVIEGPVHIASTYYDVPDYGYSSAAAAQVVADGIPGTAVVEVVANGTNLSKRFTFSVVAAEFAVWHLGTAEFISGVNGSRPAVDTIPVGATMRWSLEDFDYDAHTLVSVGTPSFPDLQVGYYDRLASMTFTEPGTYHYQDSTYPTATGTLVVR